MRVAVTTTSDSYDRWAKPLARRSFEPVSLPCIEMRVAGDGHLERARMAVAGADLVLLTSPRAVRLLWPEGEMPSVPAAVVGPATGAAVEAAGGTVSVTGDSNGDGLVDRLIEDVAGRRIVFPGARSADPARVRRLREAGAAVEPFTVYETVPIAPADDRVDAAVFGSPSAVRGWILSRTLEEVSPVAAMGETTAAELRRAAREPDIVPSWPSVEAIVDGLVAIMEKAR